MKILFTSIGRRVELLQAFRKAAESSERKLLIYGADISDTAPALRFCDRTFIVPKIHDDAYIPSLLQICKSEGIQALIPTIDTDLLLLSKSKDKFRSTGTEVLISEPDKIRICRDKRLTTDFFRSCGLSAPETFDDVEKYDLGFPAFIKPKDGSSSINAFKAENFRELSAYSEQIPDYIIQPFVSGTEYTVDVFCGFDGEPIFITPRIRSAVRAGEVLKTEIRQDSTIIEEMKKLISAFKPCGAITVQLIKDNKTGKNSYIEINPRFGGGAPLSIKAGANSASALLCLLNGEKIGFIPGAAEDGSVFSRFDQSIRV